MAKPTKEQILQFLNSQFSNPEGISIDSNTMIKWSRSSLFTLQDIESNPDIPWNKEYVGLSTSNSIQELIGANDEGYLVLAGARHDITIDVLLANIDRPWNWCLISGNTGLPIHDLVTKFPDKINWKCIMERPDFTQIVFDEFSGQIPLSVLIMFPSYFLNTP